MFYCYVSDYVPTITTCTILYMYVASTADKKQTRSIITSCYTLVSEVEVYCVNNRMGKLGDCGC